MEKRISLVQAKIADIKKRIPAHSTKPSMIQELEELEEELENLLEEKKLQDKNNSSRYR